MPQAPALQRIRVDGPRALRLLTEVVDELGEDYVYRPLPPDPDDPDDSEAALSPTCVYVRGGYPDCLIARALYRAGVTVAELERLVGPIGEVVLPLRLELTPGARAGFAAAQAMQDQLQSYGLAQRCAADAVAGAGELRIASGERDA